MSNDDNWVETRITESGGYHPSVTQAVLAQIDQMLKGQLSERQLSQTRLNSIAETLIMDMVPVPPNADTTQ